MSKVINVMVNMLEEQAALIHRHINALKQLSGENLNSEPVQVDGPKKKVKAPVDPNRPKRPLTGYQLFMADHNASFKEKNPDASATAIMSMVAGAWTACPPEQKEKYLASADKLRTSYLEDMSEYNASKLEHHDEDAVVPKAAKATSSAATKKAAAAPVVPVVSAPAVVISSTPKEEKHKKHKRSDSMDSDAQVLFAAPETDKKKKVKHTNTVLFDIITS